MSLLLKSSGFSKTDTIYSSVWWGFSLSEVCVCGSVCEQAGKDGEEKTTESCLFYVVC